MGTRADFYLGRGTGAEWLCSTAWDGYPESIDDALLDATSNEAFAEALRAFVKGRDDVSTPENGWPWPWKDSHTSDYAYAYDDGCVWISGYWGNGYSSGQSWWLPVAELRKHEALWLAWRARQKARGGEDDPGDPEPPDEPHSDIEAEFPDMTDVQNVTLGGRSGVLILSI